MATQTKIILNKKPANHFHSLKEYPSFQFVRTHAELIAALLSGVLILSAWLFSSMLSSNAQVAVLLSAFVIGGFAKAKEGIEETIQDRTLNVELLMILAAIGSASIGYWTEGAILIFIFALSGALETYTMNKSEKEIASLMDLQPETAWKLTDNGTVEVRVEELTIGDSIVIKAGERIPADGKIIKGSTTIDESALTGESIPVEKEIDEDVFTGTVNGNGNITVEINKLSSESLFQKIVELVQAAKSERSPSQLFIERFESTYVKIVLLTVAFMMFLPHYLVGWSWTDTIYRAMILLVVASPCALVASIMPATLSSISSNARNGVLFKGGLHLENLASIKAIAFDKTGTLTEGKPAVTDNLVKNDIDTTALHEIVGSIEKASTHPLAQAVVNWCEKENYSTNLEVDEIQTISGKGVKAIVNGDEWLIGSARFVGTEKAENFLESYGNTFNREAKTIVYVAKEEVVVAAYALKDQMRKDTLKAIQTFNNLGIKTIMLTGDNESTAKAIAAEANISEYHANCLPQDKVEILKKLREKEERVAMIGDGINDAPALATANLGIAMGAGSDVALETADVVLVKNNLPKIVEALQASKRMNRVIKQNVIFSIAVILVLITSNFLQAIDLPLGVIGHEGSTILVILNGLRLLKI
ncbi:heavy metal translocating P-type ATPase [Saliterribacillus persicus]|uniref:Cd2+/Zn2+-exporting ATPase n=1 Tax=Saliterribacillus persicus TaxID=930114 RepID=A0A368X727_9BACI|nr:heavy metal translocating P-type ATPase [Saliterribacillus persicus]RCW62996.1 Cd2+/Zn2+-exporting ATPase [Saliterribacillus persicus]